MLYTRRKVADLEHHNKSGNYGNPSAPSQMSVYLLREIRDPVILTQMLQGACEEGYLSCTESTSSAQSLISLRLFFAVFYLSAQKSNSMCFLSCPMAHGPEQITYENEKGGAWRSLRRTVCNVATRR